MLSVNSISLVQFKNYGSKTFDFPNRITGICGLNGIGKTNLLDAIYYLCFTRSYFARTDSQNVQHRTAGFRLDGRFDLNGEELQTVCVIRETGKKEFSVNTEMYDRFSAHIGRFPCVVIAPDDVHIITDASEERRRFLDALLSQQDAVYLRTLIDYTRVLQQRNSYLRSLTDRRADHNLLDTYDMQLADSGTTIFNFRQRFLENFIPRILHLYEGIAGKAEGLSITYKSQLIHDELNALLRSGREKDIILQRTSAGIHRDDLELVMNSQPFKSIASQGQRKSLLFALKLAEFDSLRETKGFAPILLLDDVFEKLDADRMHNLLAKVCTETDAQIIVTDTHAERITKHLETLNVDYGIITLS